MEKRNLVLSAESIAAKIAATTRNLRNERGLSLDVLATRAGITKSHLWELEQGRSKNPTIATCVALARALGISLEYLTGLDSSTPALHPDAMRIACEIDALLRRKWKTSATQEKE